MDRTRASGACDVGSIPTGSTSQLSINNYQLSIRFELHLIDNCQLTIVNCLERWQSGRLRQS